MDNPVLLIVTLLVQVPHLAGLVCATRPATERVVAPALIEAQRLLALDGMENGEFLGLAVGNDSVEGPYTFAAFEVAPDGQTERKSAIRLEHFVQVVRSVHAGEIWWFAATGWQGRTHGTTFVRRLQDGLLSTFIPHRRHAQAVSIPVAGNGAPATVYVFGVDQRLNFIEVSLADEVRSWVGGGEWHRFFTADWWTAERLRDDSIALVSIEGESHDRLMLRILSGDGDVAREIDLSDRWLPWEAAITHRENRVAVVAGDRSSSRRLRVAIVNLDDETTTGWVEISSKAGGGRNKWAPKVVATAAGFVVAWIDRDGEEEILRVCELSDVGTPGPAFDVARTPRRGPHEDFAFSVSVDSIGLRFVWRSAESILTRRVLLPVEDFIKADQLLDSFCFWAGETTTSGQPRNGHR